MAKKEFKDKTQEKKKEPVITVKKPEVEVIEKKPQGEEFDEDDEDFVSEMINQGTSSSYRYPFLRRMSTIRIQPVSAPLEIELGDIETPREKEEDNADAYKPANLDKNYSLNQKYELAGGGASYDKMTPKTINAPVSLSLNPNFSDQMNAARGFGNQNTTASYPGQESGERKYDSGLEQQTREQDRRRSM